MRVAEASEGDIDSTWILLIPIAQVAAHLNGQWRCVLLFKASWEHKSLSS